MQVRARAKRLLGACLVACAISARPPIVHGQNIEKSESENGQESTQRLDLASIKTLVQDLQSQVLELSAQVSVLKAQQQSTELQSEQLRRELDLTRSQLAALTRNPSGTESSPVLPRESKQQPGTEDRIATLEENQQLADAKIAEQSQTKVESGSKYRVRLSGIVLFNLFGNTGQVDNLDYPQLAIAPRIVSEDRSFGATLRQSQIGIQAFGPTIAGARTSADVQFDFAGGFPSVPNGVSFAIMRLRTGIIRFDWAETSVVAGQDSLFFAPLSPTSLATLAIPALAYSGDLWSWTPQVHAEHRFKITDSSSFQLQGGILDSLSGDVPLSGYYRYPSFGEYSGQPAYAARIAWTRKRLDQKTTVGIGGYYARQAWGYGRAIDGWASTIDVTLPLAKRLEFTGAFYRGRAVGGLGGGVRQSVLWNGLLTDPMTQIYGLNSIGGWAQLKLKATPKLQLNGAFGQDNPFASELREFASSPIYYRNPISRNQSAFANFIYQPRSPVVLSFEYRWLKTHTLDSNANAANLLILSIGFIF
jgi:hypothetical protein